MVKDTNQCFNLIATTFRRMERSACYELVRLLGQVGDKSPTVLKSEISGLIMAKTTLDPIESIAKLRQILVAQPYEFRYLLRVMPIEKVVCTDLAEIEKTSTELSSKIEKHETFRITLEKRFSALHSGEIIETVAANIVRKVNLTKPEKILLIEIMGEITGISLITPNDILSVLKEKML